MSDEREPLAGGPLAAGWNERVAALDALEARLAAAPCDVGLRLARAAQLERMALSDLARDAYVGILNDEPYHLEAMLALGRQLESRGDGVAATAIFREATARHASDPRPFVALGGRLLGTGDHAPAARAFEAAIALDPDAAGAQRGRAVAADLRGDDATATAAWRRAFPHGEVRVERYRGVRPPVRVLAIGSAVGGNIPLAWALDNRSFALTRLIAESYVPGTPLPAHDVAFNVCGDADRCGRGLRLAARAAADLGGVVLNDPLRVQATTREAIAARVRAVPGVVTPRMRTFARAELAGGRAATVLAAAGFPLPVLVRSPGFHTGEHFAFAADARALDAAVDALPGAAILAIEYLDTRADDGTYRKYRVLFVDGVPYPVHLAIGAHWKVHYFSADMRESAAHRAADAAFLADMPGTLGAPAMRALTAIAQLLALDYAGVDFAFDRNGELVVFEANATMVVLPPPPGDAWRYRGAPMRRIIDAVRAMIVKRISARSSSAEKQRG